MSGPLAGIRVLDVTSGMPGAVATMLLSDYGAEVIKVERPGGDVGRRTGSTRTWDRGKRSIVLDLHDAGDREVLSRLAATADVMVEALRPGFLGQLGLSAEAIRRRNPTIVHCAISAFGPDQGEGEYGYDALAAARFGVMAESPGHRDGPIFPGHPAIDYGTGMLATIGVLAAVRARLVTGAGDQVTVTMRDGVMAQMAMNWWSQRNLSFIAAKSRTGTLDMGRRRLLLQRYVCADGKMIQIHTGAAGGFGRAMQVLGLDEDLSSTDRALETEGLLTDQDLEVLRTRLPAIFRSRPAAEWLERFWANEVACLPVQPPGAVFDDEQVRYAGVMQTVDDHELGLIEIVGPVLRFSETPGEVTGPSPALNQDDEQIRAGQWLSAGLNPTGAARSLSHPLDGIRIVEFGNWFASPFGNRLLAELGADVVKVEPLQGDPIRPLPDPCEGANRGKRSLAIDLKAKGAAEVLRRLMLDADVVQHNLRPGVAERLGIDYDSTRAQNPGVVYGYAPGYGSSGPKSKLQSFAPLLSGFVGLMHMAAGAGNEPHTPFGNEDYYNGLLSATSILLALVHRQREGQGQYVESPQLHSSLLVTSEWYLKDGERRSTLPTLDSEQMGWGPVYRVYQCLDGWVAVACVTDEHVAALVKAVASKVQVEGRVVPVDASGPPGEALSEWLAYEFFGAAAADWIGCLRTAGVPSEVVVEDSWYHRFLLADEMVRAGYVAEIDHPLHGRARTVGELFHLRDHPVVARGRAPLLGEDSGSILSELGFEGDEITALVEGGAVGLAG